MMFALFSILNGIRDSAVVAYIHSSGITSSKVTTRSSHRNAAKQFWYHKVPVSPIWKVSHKCIFQLREELLLRHHGLQREKPFIIVFYFCMGVYVFSCRSIALCSELVAAQSSTAKLVPKEARTTNAIKAGSSKSCFMRLIFLGLCPMYVQHHFMGRMHHQEPPKPVLEMHFLLFLGRIFH